MRIEYFDSFEGPNRYDFLSNFYPSTLHFRGGVYPTGEHLFQAFKARDLATHDNIRWAKTPGQAKTLGRQIELRPDWENIKYDAMRVTLWYKFAPKSKLAEMLLATDDAMLLEGNTWNDTVWGASKTTLVGRNWLGHLLMARRAELASGEIREANIAASIAFVLKGVRYYA